MKISKRSYVLKVLIGLIVLSILFFFLISYESGRTKAVKYLQIVTIYDEESRNVVKEEIYYIVSPEIQEAVFDGKLDIGKVPAIRYEINSIKGYMKGINDFTFIINWSSNDYLTINSAVVIQNGIVVDAYRID